MKKLALPSVNDIDIIRALAQNSLLSETSYPHLRDQLSVIEAAYDDYINNHGNAWMIACPLLTKELKAGLKIHYASPPAAVNFLDELRRSSPEVCPMCGAFSPTTLDHIFPKKDYPAWSIFSRNLVPACSCNSFRKTGLLCEKTLSGRILHPYFDNVLTERLLTVTFTHSADFRFIEPKLSYIDVGHDEHNAIRFHTENVVLKNKIQNWLDGQVSKLLEFPANVIKGLPRRCAIDANTLLGSLQDCLEGFDGQCGTPNNWNSFLIHGLLHATSMHTWIVDTHNTKILAL